MIQLTVREPNAAPRSNNWTQAMIKLGRANTNDIVFAVDNVSGQHAQIQQAGDTYILRDMKSTNGTLVFREGKKYVLRASHPEMMILEGDRICLANQDNMVIVDRIEMGEVPQIEMDDFERTILAEQSTHTSDAESALSEDSIALRQIVRLSRELVGQRTIDDIANLTCEIAMQAFPDARRVLFLMPRDEGYAIQAASYRDAVDAGETTSTLLRTERLLRHCLQARKGFLFLLESDQVKAIGTRVTSIDDMETPSENQERIVICSPLLHADQPYGFLEIEASLGSRQKPTLTRRDLSLATLMSHLIAATLHEIETQNARMKLARKATAGYLSATVGHCFKNLLFVPMSMSKLLPISLRDGRMEEVEYMLQRNQINIRYLDALSNEFAAASKDPKEGFEKVDPTPVLDNVAELLRPIASEKIEVHLNIPEPLGPIVCHCASLNRLLMNITLNAVDALLGMKREEKGHIILEAMREPGDQYLSLVVRDNGPGIPSDILENLVHIYRQVQVSADALGELETIAERVASTKDQGFKEHYGLGFLFVCQTVRLHEGELSIESEPDLGTTFYVRIPINGPQNLDLKFDDQPADAADECELDKSTDKASADQSDEATSHSS